jgi:hypothetical protein
MNITKPQSPLLLEGSGEFVDSPERLNRWLYGAHRFLPLVRGRVWDISLSETDYRQNWGSTRVFRVLRFERLEDGLVIHQPVYRSSGLATPGTSRAGQWWPCCGAYTQAYCELRGHGPDWVGYIGKKYQLESGWYHHGKELNKLTPVHRQALQILERAV